MRELTTIVDESRDEIDMAYAVAASRGLKIALTRGQSWALRRLRSSWERVLIFKFAQFKTASISRLCVFSFAAAPKKIPIGTAIAFIFGEVR